ncbi:MAG: hypothetical protein ABSF58_15005, partial [Solirubrobacteraceae bacterium]
MAMTIASPRRLHSASCGSVTGMRPAMLSVSIFGVVDIQAPFLGEKCVGALIDGDNPVERIDVDDARNMQVDLLGRA